MCADFTLVAPKVAGFVQDVLVEDNQPVKAGQLLARLDDRDFRTALAAAEADVLGAEANLANAEANLQRQQALIETGAGQGPRRAEPSWSSPVTSKAATRPSPAGRRQPAERPAGAIADRYRQRPAGEGQPQWMPRASR